MTTIPHGPPPSDVPAARRERKAQAASDTWQHDPQLEAADELRRTNPAAYSSLPPTVKIALGHYTDAKTTRESS